MPELVEQMYCSQQIVIPPKFPYILKRFAKAAIKTQPYDLLRWSFEYFKALSENRTPPVKLRLEYPIFATEGGLTRGYLKILATQLQSMQQIPIHFLKYTWNGACLDPMELKRILCLCGVYKRADEVAFNIFIAVAGGLLTQCLTQTLILLCETLTKEPEGGSGAIPLGDFVEMYEFLAHIDASVNVKYFDGYKQGQQPEIPEHIPEEVPVESDLSETSTIAETDEDKFEKISLIDGNIYKTAALSDWLNRPFVDKIDRSPSVERAGQIARENYLRERKVRATANKDIDDRLRQISGSAMQTGEKDEAQEKQQAEDVDPNKVFLRAFDEDGNEKPVLIDEFFEDEELPVMGEAEEEHEHKDIVLDFWGDYVRDRNLRIQDLEETFEEIAKIVDKFQLTHFDLSMIAGRQMSTTSAEFIVKHIGCDILAYIDEQIAILPDPDLKKKKAKPEEVAMVRKIVDDYFDENLDIICLGPAEEEEQSLPPIPEITVVYAVPGIGPPVADRTVRTFIAYVRDVAKVQENMVLVRNMRHFMCPIIEFETITKQDKIQI